MPESAIYESPLTWEPVRPATAVIMCVDGRWRPHILDFATNSLSSEPTYDVLAVPGGIEPLTLEDIVPKDFSFMRRRLESLVEAHGTDRIVAVAHQDCAWYRMKESGPRKFDIRERQISDLRRSARWLRGKFPEIRIETYYARLTGTSPQRVVFDPVA
jgi:hypothetical protein